MLRKDSGDRQQASALVPTGLSTRCLSATLYVRPGGGGYGGGYGGGGARGGTYATTRRRPTPPRSGLHMFVAGFTFATNERVRRHADPVVAAAVIAAAG